MAPVEERSGWKKIVPTSIVAGSMAGMCSVVACHPFDTIRTRLQASPHRFSGFFNCAGQTIRNESIRGLYKGFWPPFFSQAVYKAVIFTVSTHVRNQLMSEPLQPPSTYVSMLSGSVAGGVNAFLVAPVELARNRLQIQYDSASTRYRTSLECLRYVVRTQGWQGIWHGLSATILRDSLGVACYFAGFEYAKPHCHVLVAGAFGGVCFWTVALPFDTIKTLMQVDGRNSQSFYQTTRLFVETYGYKQLFRGWQAAFSRGIPGAAITFSTYQLVQDSMQHSSG